MNGNYLQVTREKLDELLADPESVPEFLGEEHPEGAHLDTHKDWELLHFLLTGSAELGGGAPPLSWAVMGDATLGVDYVYGPASYLTPVQVKEVADALLKMELGSILDRFDPAAMAEAGLHPGGWIVENGVGRPGELSEKYREHIVDLFRQLRQFMRKAARRGMAVITYIS